MNEQLHPLQEIEQRIAHQLNRGDSLINRKAPDSKLALDAFARLMLNYDAGEFTAAEFESQVRKHLRSIHSGFYGWEIVESDLRSSLDKKEKKKLEEGEVVLLPEPDPNESRIEILLMTADPLEDPWPDITNHQKAFLLKLMHVGALAKACIAGITVVHHYGWLRSSDTYREAYEDVRRYFADQALERLTEIAFNGELLEDPNDTDNGRPVKKRRYDRRLLIFLITRQDKKDQARVTRTSSSASGTLPSATRTGAAA